jgi:hypothetical protein
MDDHKRTQENVDIDFKLGQIVAKLDNLEKANTRTVLALIGVITAQIGVKILGTPILLDIATAIGIIGAVLMAGILLLRVRMIKDGVRLTSTGISLAVMLAMITITQVGVYFRDMGILQSNCIYIIRIVQNLTIVAFAWMMLVNTAIFKSR